MSQDRAAQCAMQYCAAEHLVAALTMKSIPDNDWPSVKQITISEHQAQQIAELYPVDKSLLANVFQVEAHQ